MNWLHCNNCGAIKTPKTVTEFFIATCSHVFCGQCIGLQQCPIDNRHFKTIKISRSMPPNLIGYFKEPEELLTPWQKCIRFQFEQRSLYEATEFPRNLKRIQQLREEVKVMDKTLEAINRGNEKDAKRNQKMRAYIKYLVQQKQARRRSDGSHHYQSSRSVASLDFSSSHGDTGVDLRFDELNLTD